MRAGAVPDFYETILLIFGSISGHVPGGEPPRSMASRHITEVAKTDTATWSIKFPEAFRDMRPKCDL